LKELFKDIILALGSIKLTCYIDALDECPETSIRDMLGFLENLGTSTLTKGIAFSIMLSSRHYPHITIRHASQLVLESTKGHHQDISAYIHDKLRMDDSELIRDLASELESRSASIFLWVVLVVAILNEVYDRGNRHLLLDRLNKIPQELHNLFQQTIQKGLYDRANVVTLLLWILFAKQPLTLRECYHAVVASQGGFFFEGWRERYYTVVGSQEGFSFEGWDPSKASIYDMTRFIVDTSRGLAEMTRGILPNVQFIHESVRDFLFTDGLGLLEPGLTNVDESNAGIIHEQLYHRCRRYVLQHAPLVLRHSTDGFREQMQKDAMSARVWVVGQCPFMEYALEGMLYHAESAIRYLHAYTFLIDFQTFPLTIWIRLHNLVVHDSTHRIGLEVSLEYVSATRGCYYLLEEAIRNESQVDHWDRRIKFERHTCLLDVARDRNDQKMVDMLKNHGATEG
jgi:hypothetical protein